MRWRIAFYMLEDTPDGIDSIMPDSLPIVGLPGAESYQFWPRVVRAKKARVAAREPAAFLDADEDLDANEAVGDDGGDEEGAALDGLLDKLFHEDCQLFHEAAGGPVAEPLQVVEPPPAAESLDPPAPPPPAPHAVPRAYRGRVRADATWDVEGGRISYYKSKNTFEAVCDNPDHGPQRCILSRAGRGAVPLGQQSPACTRGQRPLGMLMAWLASNTQENRAGHWDETVLFQPHGVRALYRTLLEESEGGRELLKWERDLFDGEESEPFSLDDYNRW